MELPQTIPSQACILSLCTLKTTMESIINSTAYHEDTRTPRSPNRRKSMSDLKQQFDCKLLCIKTKFLSDSDTLSLNNYWNRRSVLTSMGDDETALIAEQEYFKTVEVYCANYKSNCFSAFAYIPKVLEYIIEIEQIRKRNKQDLYEPSHQCQELIPKLEELIQQEKERLNNKSVQNNAARKERYSFSFTPLK